MTLINHLWAIPTPEPISSSVEERRNTAATDVTESSKVNSLNENKVPRNLPEKICLKLKIGVGRWRALDAYATCMLQFITRFQPESELSINCPERSRRHEDKELRAICPVKGHFREELDYWTYHVVESLSQYDEQFAWSVAVLAMRLQVKMKP